MAAGRCRSTHACRRKYKGLILRFNADIAEKNVGIHSAAYLFNLVRRRPEPLEDPRYRQIIDDTHLFLADDADAALPLHREIRPAQVAA